MALVLNNNVVAILTQYQGYKEIVFTGIKGHGTKVSITVSNNVTLNTQVIQALADTLIK